MPPADSSRDVKKQLRQLHFRLVATRARLLATRSVTGLATALALLVGLFTAEMTLDWLVHLPWLARACFSLPAIAGACWILYREIILPLLRLPSDHAVACEIERALPVFQTRLIASIQLGRESESRGSALVGALIRETAAIAAAEDFRKIVKTAKLFHMLRVLAAIVVIAGGLAWLGRGNVTLLLERALLLTTRLPTRTQIDKIDAPAKIAAGSDLKIAVTAHGVLPDSGVVLSQIGSRITEYPLQRDPAHKGEYDAVIHSVTESLTFRVRLNDATSDDIPVTVLSPPAILGIHCVEIYPAYTKLPPVERPTGDLSLLAGSILRLNITASQPVANGSAHLAGLEKDTALTADPANAAQARVDIPIPKSGLTVFSLHVVDSEGVASQETARYRIVIVPDRPPTIKLANPGQATLATSTATVTVRFHAEDDFGVAKVFLHYMVKPPLEKVISFDLTKSTPRQLDRRFAWNLTFLKVVPDDVVEYWLEAVDANNVTGPGSGLTDHAHIKIVTEAEKRAELAARFNEALGPVDQAGNGEEELARHLGTQIPQKPAAP